MMDAVARRSVIRTTSLAIALGVTASISCGSSADERANVGASLVQLVKTELAQKADKAGAAGSSAAGVNLSIPGIRDEQSRVLVTILLKEKAARESALALPGLRLVADDMNYRGGVMEAFVPVEQVFALARQPGVSAVHMVVRPVTDSIVKEPAQ